MPINKDGFTVNVSHPYFSAFFQKSRTFVRVGGVELLLAYEYYPEAFRLSNPVCIQNGSWQDFV